MDKCKIGDLLKIFGYMGNITLIVRQGDMENIYRKRQEFDELPYDAEICGNINLEMYYSSAGKNEFLKCIVTVR